MVNALGPDPLGGGIHSLRQVGQETAARLPEQDGEEDFEKMLGRLISEVDEAQKAADDSIRRLASGQETNIQEVVTKLGEADLTFKLMKEIRDKLVTAYKEIISMQS